MEEKIREFKNYRTDKRLEISTMSSLIRNLSDEFNKKEKNLLISSYIVLTYAYWESSFHKFQYLMYESYKLIPIKNLPHTLKNDVSLSLARMSSGKNKQKIISEIKKIDVFEGIMKTIEEDKNSNVLEIFEKYKDRVDETEFRKHFLIETANPNLERTNEVMKKYGMKLNKIIDKGLDEQRIKTFFSDGLSFIIDQRNSIAHKNEKIILNEIEYDDYDTCIYKFAQEVGYYEGDKDLFRPESFINEMTFQIDSFFDLMVREATK